LLTVIDAAYLTQKLRIYPGTKRHIARNSKPVIYLRFAVAISGTTTDRFRGSSSVNTTEDRDRANRIDAFGIE
jgi:hypothetical protein